MASKLQDRCLTPYVARLNALAKDKKITPAESEALVKELEQKGAPDWKRLYAATFVAGKGALFAPGEAQRVNDAIKRWHPEPEREVPCKPGWGNPKPAPNDWKSGVRYQPVKGEVVTHGISVNDPRQGHVGDCYFIAALSAVALTHPEILEKNIKTNPNGTYSVTFFQRSKQGASTPVTVTVDGTFPLNDGRPQYAHSQDPRELWPMIYEKAFAKWQGGYEQTRGGLGTRALEVLTGAKADYFSITSDTDPKQVLAGLKSALANKGCVVAGSQAFGSDVEGMRPDHEYTVLGIVNVGGTEMIRVRNPWGVCEPGVDNSDDGVFLLTPAQFKRAFGFVEFASP